MLEDISVRLRVMEKDGKSFLSVCAGSLDPMLHVGVVLWKFCWSCDLMLFEKMNQQVKLVELWGF
jgi:hypothetical protein